jgi:hypothetical protein
MKNKDNLLYIGGSVVIIVLAIIFVLLLMQVLQPMPATMIEPTPTLYEFPTAAASATIEPSPTNTAEPTATNTVQPTRTPVPTATVDVEATAQAEYIEDYLVAFDEVNGYLHDTKTAFDNRFGEMIEGKVSEHDEIWKKDVTDYLIVFGVYQIVLLGIDPPAEYQQAHDLVLAGVNACFDGWFDMYDATQVGDTALYNQGVQQVVQCNRKWSQGEDLIANLRR